VKRFAANCLVVVLACVAVGSIGGCIEAHPGLVPARDIPLTPKGSVSASEMGLRLGLMLQRNSAHSAALGNQHNSVLLFADPGGVAYVNGAAVGKKGGITAVNNTLYVPASLEQDIRLAMRSARIYTTTPRRSVSPRHSSPPVKKIEPKYGPIVLDPGHGGRDPGAGHNGCVEKDIVLSVALMAADMMRASGVDVRLTRGDDTFIELNDRAALAGDVGAKLLLSLHCDAAANRGARGFTLYTPRTRMGQAGPLAAALEKSMGAGGQENRGIRAAGFRVLMRTSCPAVLLEMGFLTNRYDARLLGDKSHQRTLARAIADGVIAYLTR
jgi:N-acetylmuramoyl-L-alanine amidase